MQQKAEPGIPKQTKNSGSKKPLKRFIIKLVLLVAAVGGLLTFAVGVHIQRGNGMFPALRDGDLVITLKGAAFRQGDIAAYRDPENGKLRFSRVCGLPGYLVDINGLGEYLTNGVPAAEEVFYRTERAEGSPVIYPLQIGEGEYFLLDDQRLLGRDSRSFGPVSRSELLGKVVFIIRRRGF